MKIALVNPAFESLGVEYISSVLKTRHETFLVFDPLLFNDNYICIKFMAKIFDYTKQILRQISSESPQLIAFSVTSDTYGWACKLAQTIKNNFEHIPIVFGGVHVTAVPLEVLKNPFVDYIISGEGEYPMLDLADALEQCMQVNEIMNLGYKKDEELIINPPRTLIQTLDELPFPDKDLFFSRNPYRLFDYGIITSRGCYYACTYCHNSADRKRAWNKHGKYFRQRSVTNVIEELKIAKKKYNYKEISIWDECFTFNLEWLKEFCLQYKSDIGVPFWTNVHPDHVTEEIIRMLEYAGCSRVEMGVQILNPEIKKNILHRHETKETIENVINMFRKSKVRIEIDIILGIPFMQESDYVELVEFFNKAKPNSIHTFWLRYYPTTEIIDIAKENNILSDEEIMVIEQGKHNISSILGGNTKNHLLEKYQAFLTFLPHLSEKSVNKILEKNWIRFIPRITAINRIILYVLDLKYHDEVIGKRFIKKTFYFMWRKLIWVLSLRKSKP